MARITIASLQARINELEHQLKDAGVETIVILENFANVLQQVLPRTPIKHVVLTRIGDLLGAPKSWLVNFAVKHVKKMVPAWKLPAVTLSEYAEVEGDGCSLGPNPVDVRQAAAGKTIAVFRGRSTRIKGNFFDEGEKA